MRDNNALYRVRLRDLVDDEVFGGATNGEDLLAELISSVRNLPKDISVLALDFNGVKVATSSFLRTSVLGFRAYWQADQRNVPIVVCNLTATVAEELNFLLTQVSDAMVTCELVKSKVRKQRILGKLEQKEQDSLKAVEASKEPIDARGVAIHHGENVSGGKRFTRWNNPLASLTKKGILVERNEGRKKLYSFSVRST